ncbi:hypothetical protein EDB85DRAFT_529835 [Lactarius pseudohatsudake]|nr:hypothetical protein EDB85DRAFT_529835 [Lactarius pseudohatsudake]
MGLKLSSTSYGFTRPRSTQISDPHVPLPDLEHQVGRLRGPVSRESHPLPPCVVEAVRAAWATGRFSLRPALRTGRKVPKRTRRGYSCSGVSSKPSSSQASCVDLIDISSGGNWSTRHRRWLSGQDIRFRLQKQSKKLIQISPWADHAKAGERYVSRRKADIVSLARGVLRDPHFVLREADELRVPVKPVVQTYWRGLCRYRPLEAGIQVL